MTDAGEKVPFGSPVCVSPTGPEKPPVAPTVTVYEAFVPCVTVELVGETPDREVGRRPRRAGRGRDAAIPFGVPRPVGPS